MLKFSNIRLDIWIFIFIIAYFNVFVICIDINKYIIISKSSNVTGDVRAIFNKGKSWKSSEIKHMPWLKNVRDMHIHSSAYFLRIDDPSESGIYQLEHRRPENIKNSKLMLPISDVNIGDGLFCYYNHTGFLLNSKDGKHTLYKLKNSRKEMVNASLNFDGIPKRIACKDQLTPIFIGTSRGIYYLNDPFDHQSFLAPSSKGKDILSLQISLGGLLYSYVGGKDIYYIDIYSLDDIKEKTLVKLNREADFTFYYSYDLLIISDKLNGITPIELTKYNNVLKYYPSIGYRDIENPILYAYIPLEPKIPWLSYISIAISVVSLVFPLFIAAVAICNITVVIPGISCISQFCMDSESGYEPINDGSNRIVQQDNP